MNRYELAREALDDLDALWLYIAEDNINAADQVVTSILDACDLLADQPRIGHTRTDLTERPVLFWSSGKYLIVYRPQPTPIRVIAIFHSARDVAALLTDRN